MLTGKCYPRDQANSNWLYCPSISASILFSTLFGTTTLIHCVQAIVYRRRFALIGITGAIWETCGYIFRTLSVHDQLSAPYFDTHWLLLLLAPLWINAYVYMVLGRMVHFYLENDRIFGLKARYLTIVFIALDLTAFSVQAAGATMAIIALSLAGQWAGIYVYITGVGLQMLFLVLFIVSSARFQYLLQEQGSSRLTQMVEDADIRSRELKFAIWPLRGVYAALLLLIFRTGYRIAEYSHGLVSNITTHEWYTYVFDATPMLFTLVIFNVFNPGTFLRTPRPDFSGDNSRWKKITKAARFQQNAQES